MKASISNGKDEVKAIRKIDGKGIKY